MATWKSESCLEYIVMRNNFLFTYIGYILRLLLLIEIDITVHASIIDP